jgi:hypothetical protein
MSEALCPNCGEAVQELGGLSERERIEEAHGIWELAVVRLAALVGSQSRNGRLIADAHEAEREAYRQWVKASNAATEPRR